MQTSLATDGLLLSLVAAVYLALLLRRVLRRSPSYTGWTLLGIVVVCTLARLFISREAILTAWTYTRVVPLAKAISNGVVFEALRDYFGHPVHLTDLIFNTNFVLASLSPLPLFLHANFLLKDIRSALAAVALLAILPVHITFARSDVYFIQSLFFSSLAFATLYSALSDPSKGWRLLSLAFLGPLLFTVFLARPLNLIFCPLLLVTAFVTVARDVPMERRWIAAFVITVPAVLDVVVNLMVGYSSQVEEGLGLRTLLQAGAMLFDLQRNTVINPWVTPPVIPILMVIGLRYLWNNDQRPIALYLFGWLTAFFVTHAYIVPFRTTMMARYHLHLVTPVVLIAAAATPRILEYRPKVRVAIVALLAASPLLHLGFERGVDFSIQREFELLVSLRPRVPQGCTVVDYLGPADCPRGPRVERVAAYAGPERSSRWESLPLIGPARERSERPLPRGALDVDGLAGLVDSGRCVLFYEGNLCRAYGKNWEQLAPTCREVHRRFELETIASQEYVEHIYDPADARGACAPPPTGAYEPPTDRATLRLYRITGQRPTLGP